MNSSSSSSSSSSSGERVRGMRNTLEYLQRRRETDPNFGRTRFSVNQGSIDPDDDYVVVHGVIFNDVVDCLKRAYDDLAHYKEQINTLHEDSPHVHDLERLTNENTRLWKIVDELEEERTRLTRATQPVDDDATDLMGREKQDYEIEAEKDRSVYAVGVNRFNRAGSQSIHPRIQDEQELDKEDYIERKRIRKQERAQKRARRAEEENDDVPDDQGVDDEDDREVFVSPVPAPAPVPVPAPAPAPVDDNVIDLVGGDDEVGDSETSMARVGRVDDDDDDVIEYENEDLGVDPDELSLHLDESGSGSASPEY